MRIGLVLAAGGSVGVASAAVPAYFRPVEIGGRRYVDGGVHSMVNLDLVAGAGLDLVVTVSPLSQASAWPALSPAYLMRRPLRARLQVEVEALRATGVPVVAIEPGRSVAAAMGLNPMDAARRGEVSRGHPGRRPPVAEGRGRRPTAGRDPERRRGRSNRRDRRRRPFCIGWVVPGSPRGLLLST